MSLISLAPKNFARLGATLIVLLFGCGQSAEDTKPPAGNKSKGHGEELLVFEDMPEVVSASRQKQHITQSSVPVSLVTAEDIHYGGQRTLPEVLQFVPGIDMLEFDRNRFALGVRGMHEQFSDRTLFLLDGRNAESPIFGGPEWNRYPLFMEDIDRIEVVRGPGGAAWGPNAFNGVINVIKKKPEDVQGYLFTTTATLFGDTYDQVRWAAKKGDWSWRTSAGYVNWRSSDDALGDNNHFESRDFSNQAAFDGDAHRKLGKDTDLTFGVGYQYQSNGGFEFVGRDLGLDSTYNTTRAFAKLDHKLNSKISGYVQWFGNFSTNDVPEVQKSRTQENAVEAQANIEVAKKQHLTIGANVRWLDVTAEVRRSSDSRFFSQPVQDTVAGLFAIYNYQATDRLSLEVQGRGDRYSGTQADWSTRTALILALDQEHHHTLRLAGAKAFRSPLGGFRDTYLQRFPIPAFPPFIPDGLFGITVLPNHDLKNEETSSWEVGYTGRLLKGLTVRLDTYYQRYEQLIGYFPVQQITVPLVPAPLLVERPENRSGANAFGGEFEVNYTHKWGKVSAWLAYNDFDQDSPQNSIRTYQPAKFKAGLTGRAFLPEKVVLNINYRYSDVTHGGASIGFFDAQVLHRFDLSVAKHIDGERFEIMGGVDDLFNRAKDPIHGAGADIFHETPGRTFYLRFQLKF
ncbi:MAG: TonB-dependent receptor [Planctomycetes bacterium]|nr:TonB-dependent receptor [Planctomycetota bacterium]